MKAVFEGSSKPWMGIHPGTPSSSISIVILMELRWNLSVFFSIYIAKSTIAGNRAMVLFLCFLNFQIHR